MSFLTGLKMVVSAVKDRKVLSALYLDILNAAMDRGLTRDEASAWMGGEIATLLTSLECGEVPTPAQVEVHFAAAFKTLDAKKAKAWADLVKFANLKI